MAAQVMAGLAAVQLLGSFYSAYQQREAAKEQAEMLRYQARLRMAQAQEYRKKAGVVRSVKLRQLQVLQGEQRAGFAKGGVDITSGTPLTMLDESARLAGEEILFAERDIELQARQIEQGADILSMQAAGTEKAGKIDFFSTILGGAVSSGKTGAQAYQAYQKEA